ncbi:ABC transporter ATP-binding protein [Phytohabitans kaempferiae]|uniref:ABC transporter ATP-binding protein n=1 Tax=Phytohabitans kaempferiae TaxID=1620943 RepID=A0ABV6M9A4_9ACTN
MTDPAPDRTLLPTATARRTWSVLWAELRRLPGLTAGALALLVAASASGLVAPWVLGRMVDDVIAGAGLRQVVVSALLIGGAALLAGVFTALGAALIARLGETVLARLRERVLDRALHLPSATLEKAGTGDLVSRAGDDVPVVANAITTTGPELTGALLAVLLTVAGLFALDWRLGLAGLLAAPMYALALRWYLPRSAPFYAEERIATGERSQAMVGALRGSATVRAYLLEDEHVQRIADRSHRAMDLSLSVFGTFTRFASRMNRAEFVGLTAVLVVGFLLVRGDLATVGAVTAAALYFHRLFNPIGTLMLEADSALQAGAALARLVGVADLPPPPPATAPARPAGASVEIEVTSHRYDGGPPVLHDVTLTIGPGERVALVGASGAGKSTLAGIAAGVIEPSSGSVRLGGVPLAALGDEQVRRRICLVSQEVHVFAGPLADDVRLARPEAGDEQVAAALEQVGALGWAQALPDGLHTAVGEGAHQLTTAQAQHLALARLALADPAVAVLDEATAEAGSAGAQELDRAALAATAGRTTLIVAHRLTQALNADRVVVLDQGRIVEIGSHAELVAAGGRYSHLWHGWSGGQDWTATPGAPVAGGTRS